MRFGRKILVVVLVLGAAALLAGCGGGGPEPDFDVTGMWTESGGGSTLEFLADGSYELTFDPPLSDGTTRFGGGNYDRVDNATVSFTMVMGTGSLEIIDVEAKINANNEMSFRLDGRRFTFEKTGG